MSGKYIPPSRRGKSATSNEDSLPALIIELKDAFSKIRNAQSFQLGEVDSVGTDLQMHHAAVFGALEKLIRLLRARADGDIALGSAFNALVQAAFILFERVLPVLLLVKCDVPTSEHAQPADLKSASYSSDHAQRPDIGCLTERRKSDFSVRSYAPSGAQSHRQKGGAADGRKALKPWLTVILSLDFLSFVIQQDPVAFVPSWNLFLSDGFTTDRIIANVAAAVVQRLSSSPATLADVRPAYSFASTAGPEINPGRLNRAMDIVPFRSLLLYCLFQQGNSKPSSSLLLPIGGSLAPLGRETAMVLRKTAWSCVASMVHLSVSLQNWFGLPEHKCRKNAVMHTSSNMKAAISSVQRTLDHNFNRSPQRGKSAHTTAPHTSTKIARSLLKLLRVAVIAVAGEEDPVVFKVAIEATNSILSQVPLRKTSVEESFRFAPASSKTPDLHSLHAASAGRTRTTASISGGGGVPRQEADFDGSVAAFEVVAQAAYGLVMCKAISCSVLISARASPSDAGCNPEKLSTKSDFIVTVSPASSSSAEIGTEGFMKLKEAALVWLNQACKSDEKIAAFERALRVPLLVEGTEAVEGGEGGGVRMRSPAGRFFTWRLVEEFEQLLARRRPDSLSPTGAMATRALLFSLILRHAHAFAVDEHWLRAKLDAYMSCGSSDEVAGKAWGGRAPSAELRRPGDRAEGSVDDRCMLLRLVGVKLVGAQLCVRFEESKYRLRYPLQTSAVSFDAPLPTVAQASAGGRSLAETMLQLLWQCNCMTEADHLVRTHAFSALSWVLPIQWKMVSETMLEDFVVSMRSGGSRSSQVYSSLLDELQGHGRAAFGGREGYRPTLRDVVVERLALSKSDPVGTVRVAGMKAVGDFVLNKGLVGLSLAADLSSAECVMVGCEVELRLLEELLRAVTEACGDSKLAVRVQANWAMGNILSTALPFRRAALCSVAGGIREDAKGGMRCAWLLDELLWSRLQASNLQLLQQDSEKVSATAVRCIGILCASLASAHLNHLDILSGRSQLLDEKQRAADWRFLQRAYKTVLVGRVFQNPVRDSGSSPRLTFSDFMCAREKEKDNFIRDYIRRNPHKFVFSLTQALGYCYWTALSMFMDVQNDCSHPPASRGFGSDKRVPGELHAIQEEVRTESRGLIEAMRFLLKHGNLKVRLKALQILLVHAVSEHADAGRDDLLSLFLTGVEVACSFELQYTSPIPPIHGSSVQLAGEKASASNRGSLIDYIHQSTADGASAEKQNPLPTVELALLLQARSRLLQRLLILMFWVLLQRISLNINSSEKEKLKQVLVHHGESLVDWMASGSLAVDSQCYRREELASGLPHPPRSYDVFVDIRQPADEAQLAPKDLALKVAHSLLKLEDLLSSESPCSAPAERHPDGRPYIFGEALLETRFTQATFTDTSRLKLLRLAGQAGSTCKGAALPDAASSADAVHSLDAGRDRWPIEAALEEDEEI